MSSLKRFSGTLIFSSVSLTALRFSVSSEKLAQMLMPRVNDNGYLQVDLIITKRGTGFHTSIPVEPSPPL